MASEIVSLACAWCGTSFSIPAWKARQGRRYCSRSCANSVVPRAPRSGRINPADRFWSRVEKGASSCWIWRGRVDRDGYGCFVLYDKGRRKKVRAHRYSWELHNGPICEGLVICHGCDDLYSPGSTEYRKCVNPAHLFLGTFADNSRDMSIKGRAATGERHGAYTHPERVPRGEQHGCAKLTDELVRELRAQHAAGTLNQHEASRRLGVNRRSVGDAVLRRTWRHLS